MSLPNPPPSPVEFSTTPPPEPKKPILGLLLLLALSVVIGLLVFNALSGPGVPELTESPTPTVAPSPVASEEPVFEPAEVAEVTDNMLRSWAAQGVGITQVCSLTDDDWLTIHKTWVEQGANPTNATAVIEEIKTRCESA